MAHVSRWSKYTDSSAEGPDEHEDEEEEQNVYTERPQFRSQGTRSLVKAFHLSARQNTVAVKEFVIINKNKESWHKSIMEKYLICLVFSDC